MVEVEAGSYRTTQSVDDAGVFDAFHVEEVFFEVERTPSRSIRDSRDADVAARPVQDLVVCAALKRRGETGGKNSQSGGQDQQK